MSEKNIKNKDERKEELLQLLDSSYPLIQEFREKCPGTYKHSQAVASMMESVSAVLGLDVTFMKVTAMYHDIGKINNPKFFTENQLENDISPHNDLVPWVSSQIISRHVSDSVNILLNKNKFPKEMLKIISQHHGTSVIKYFFNESEETDVDKYRYKCTRPASIEAAVLMICDRLEAMTRSGDHQGSPSELVNNVINDLLEDEQLDDITIKLGDLKRLKIVLSKELEGMSGKRVSYVKELEESE